MTRPGECAPCPLDGHSFVFTYTDDEGQRRACVHYRAEPGRPQCKGTGMPILPPTRTVGNNTSQHPNAPAAGGMRGTQTLEKTNP